MISVLIPSRTDAYLDRCLTSLWERQPDSLGCVVVADSGLDPLTVKRWADEGVRFVLTPLPFVFARAINQAAERVTLDDHLMILNDDTEAVSDRPLTAMAEFMNRNHSVGLAAPLIEGAVGNADQQKATWESRLERRLDYRVTRKTVCFTAVVIRGSAWRRVGPMDESFIGYGYDDDDYTRRCRDAGWGTVVTGVAAFAHGAAGYAFSSTYQRVHGSGKLHELFMQNRQRFIDKWGALPND